MKFEQEYLERGYHNNRLYIVQFRTVYQIHYSEAQRCYYTQEIYYCGKNESAVPLLKRGRFKNLSACEVNSLLDKELLNDDSIVFRSEKHAISHLSEEDYFWIYNRERYNFAGYAETLEGAKQKIEELEKNA